MAGTVTVRMYNVGFGDSFLVTVNRENATWRMLIDCGVHNQGNARPIRESVRAIIDDLRATADGGIPHLDVVVATHRHVDHIVGFSLDDWEEVEVGEVWLPFVANPNDPDTQALRHPETAQRLLGLIKRRTLDLNPGQWPDPIVAARMFALNSFGNTDAMDRLLSRNGQHFATTPNVRFLPDKTNPDMPLELPHVEARVHVLGPGRDPDQLKKMNPPANAGWLHLDLDTPLDEDFPDDVTPLFDPVFVVDDESRLSTTLDQTRRSLGLNNLTNDTGLLTAASILERAVNNTSLFLVLEVGGTRLVFPGDAQHGPWQHVLDTLRKRALIADAAFYKIGHHGSHNATPQQFVTKVWCNGSPAMLPYGPVERWKDTIPKRGLLDALHAHGHTVTRADAPEAIPGTVTVHADLWSELTITIA